VIKRKPAIKMPRCKGCFYKVMPNNKNGYCYRCRRGKYNVNKGKWEGGIKNIVKKNESR
jgi:hypothetical protein